MGSHGPLSVPRSWGSQHGVRAGSRVPSMRGRKSITFKSRGSLRRACYQGACPHLCRGVWVVIDDGWKLGSRGSFYGINQRTQFLSLFPRLCLSEPLPGHWLPGKRDLIPRSGMESIMCFSSQSS